MPVTTVLSEEGAATILTGNDNDGLGRTAFSWSAAFAGAFLATAVTFFLLALGTGFGLALTTPESATSPTFLTFGAIYFFVSQCFGFAAGGHLAGRLIGPMPETAAEENFRSVAHGLVVWALTVVAVALLFVTGGLAVAGKPLAAASGRFESAESAVLTPEYVGYWVDLLFRPGPGPSQASLDWTQYAQADTGNATDAQPNPDQPPPPNPAATPSPDLPETTPPPAAAPRELTPSGTAPPPTSLQPSGPPPSTTLQSSGTSSHPGPSDTIITPPPAPAFTPPASLVADKAETSKIIVVGMAKGARLVQYDKDRIAALLVQDANIGAPEAQRRVDNAETRIHDEQIQSAEAARKTARFASLWIAASLLFGALAAAFAAVSARWEGDRARIGWPRREPD